MLNSSPTGELYSKQASRDTGSSLIVPEWYPSWATLFLFWSCACSTSPWSKNVQSPLRSLEKAEEEYLSKTFSKWGWGVWYNTSRTFWTSRNGMPEWGDMFNFKLKPTTWQLRQRLFITVKMLSGFWVQSCFLLHELLYIWSRIITSSEFFRTKRKAYISLSTMVNETKGS